MKFTNVFFGLIILLFSFISIQAQTSKSTIENAMSIVEKNKRMTEYNNVFSNILLTLFNHFISIKNNKIKQAFFVNKT